MCVTMFSFAKKMSEGMSLQERNFMLLKHFFQCIDFLWQSKDETFRALMEITMKNGHWPGQER